MTPNEYFMVHVMSRFLFNVGVVVWIFCHHPSRLHHRKWVQLSDWKKVAFGTSFLLGPKGHSFMGI